jgi:CrcB protein
MRTVWIGIAGFVGAVARYRVDRWITYRLRGSFPWGTLLVNLTGCFIVGVIISIFAERVAVNSDLRAALTVGFVGAYTTFSTFAYQTLTLSENGNIDLAILYVLGSLVPGVAAVWLGILIGRAF